jgi:hypothetical protein
MSETRDLAVKRERIRAEEEQAYREREYERARREAEETERRRCNNEMVQSTIMTSWYSTIG